MEYVKTGTKDIVQNLTCVNMPMRRWRHADMLIFAQERTVGFGMTILKNSLF